MKFLVKILIGLSLLQLNTFSQWVAQPSGTTNTLRGVHFVNTNTGFICGDNVILNTTNGGLNWISNNYPGRKNDIVFVNPTTGFTCGDSGKVLKTTNAGASWNFTISGTSKFLMRISFLNESTGIVAGFSRTILKTTNSGVSWESTISNLDSVNFYGCKIIDANNYIVTGTSSTIYRSTNAGSSWIPGTMGVVNPMWAPEFINTNTGWVTGCCGMFIKTTDAGNNWTTEIYLTLGFTLYTMKFINSTTGYVCGDNGTIYRTTNQGAWWDSTVTGTDQIIYSLHMANTSTGWAVGNFGTILKTTNGGGTGFTIGIQPISNEIPNEFKLLQNYPNPFNPSTKIKFQISKSGFTKLTVFDPTGSEVGVLVNSVLNPGTYEINFDGSGLASGVYYYMLSSENYTSTRKMILIK
jgi:photosystem II stability/assembly factor-like uncharacterized protein